SKVENSSSQWPENRGEGQIPIKAIIPSVQVSNASIGHLLNALIVSGFNSHGKGPSVRTRTDFEFAIHTKQTQRRRGKIRARTLWTLALLQSVQRQTVKRV
ncbi:hypothetical protein, partial [Ruegeria sp. HKCCD8929]|uniref:hypothetical protein n=1 Tax=Ruegeria sp. HKCCD8929 TaxID=2683006 RepID=UPI001C2C57EC